MSQCADISEHFIKLHTPISRHALSESSEFMHYCTHRLFAQAKGVQAKQRILSSHEVIDFCCCLLDLDYQILNLGCCLDKR